MVLIMASASSFHREHPPRRCRLGLPFLAVALMTVGCKEADEIRHYQAPKVERRSAALSVPEYQIPADWKKKDRRRGDVFRLRDTLQAGDAEVSVTAFGGSVGSLLDNINRWRKKDLGLEPITEVPKDVAKMTVAGTEGDYVDIQGQAKRLLAVLFEHEGYSWVFMIVGPSDQVARQKPAFERFVRSTSFPDDVPR